jgi:transcriptional regulator with XRE-family HTH domain
MNLGKRVETARLALGWTQAALCAKVEGLSQQALDRLEKRDSVRSQFAPGLAAALNIPLEELLTGVAGTISATQAPNRAGLAGVSPPPKPNHRFEDRREVGDSDWATIQDINMLPPDEQQALRQDLRERAQKYRAYRDRVIAEIKGGKP